jgi:hypothetical protein
MCSLSYARILSNSVSCSSHVDSCNIVGGIEDALPPAQSTEIGSFILCYALHDPQSVYSVLDAFGAKGPM